MRYISSKAVILPPCFIGKNVYIGPYSIIGPNVIIGDNNWIDSHVVINGKCLIGINNKFSKFTHIGSYSNNDKDFFSNSYIIIGDDNIFSCGVILRKSYFTFIGSNNYFMDNSFISFDVILGNYIFLDNSVFISNNVFIDNNSFLSKYVFVQAYIFIGSFTFSADYSVIYKDVLPYSFIFGNPARFKKLNLLPFKNRKNIKFIVLRLKKIYKLLLENNFTYKQLFILLFLKKYSSIESYTILKFLLRSKRGIVI